MSAYETSLIVKYFGRTSMAGMPLLRAAQLLEQHAVHVGEEGSRNQSTHAAGGKPLSRLTLRKPDPLADADLIRCLFNQGPLQQGEAPSVSSPNKL